MVAEGHRSPDHRLRQARQGHEPVHAGTLGIDAPGDDIGRWGCLPEGRCPVAERSARARRSARRDATQERGRRRRARPPGRDGCRRRNAARLRVVRRSACAADVDAHRRSIERDLHRAVGVRPVRRTRDRTEPVDRRRRRMPVGVALARRHDSDSRPHGVEEGGRTRRPRAVVGHFEQVDLWQSPTHELGVDLLLDVARQEDAVTLELAEQDDGHVVDRSPAVCRSLRDAVRVRPEHPEPDPIELEAIARG